MTRRRFLARFKRILDDSREAVIRYLTEEIRFLERHLARRPRPTEGDKAALARAAKAVDPGHLERCFNLFRPSTLLRWHRELIARKWDYSHLRKKVGRPRIDRELEELAVKLALENPALGNESLVGILRGLGIDSNPETLRRILKRNGIGPSPGRREGMTWADFLRCHWDDLLATDFLTWEVLTPFGLVTTYILFFIRMRDRRVHIAGVTTNPHGDWMAQVARDLTDPDAGILGPGTMLLHDRDTIYTAHFDRILNDTGVRTMKLPAKSPNLNAYAERWVRTLKERCLSKLIIGSEEGLRKVLREFCEFYNHERPHQGIGNVIPLPRRGDRIGSRNGRIAKKSRLGSLLNYYHRIESDDSATVLPAENAS